jgi:hypothetical protein
MAKKARAARPKPKPKFPPRLVIPRGTRIVGVSMMTEDGGSISVNIWPGEEDKRTKA